MYNYIKMVLAHLMVVFHFNHSRRVTEKGRGRPGGSGCFCRIETEGVLLAAPRGEGSKKIKEGSYFICEIFNQKAFITSRAWLT